MAVADHELSTLAEHPAGSSPSHVSVERVSALDGLRGLAAFAVAIPHFFMEQHYDDWRLESVSIVAVEIFFILSGYVLAPQIIFCLEAKTWRRIRVFLVRRWMRTLPPYFLALFALSMLTGNLIGWPIVRYATFTQNFFTIDGRTDYFQIAWSLSVEEWFYLIFPIFLISLKSVGIRPVKAALIFVGLFFAAKLIGLHYDDDWSIYSRRIVAYRLDFIAFGFLLYCGLSRVTDARHTLIRALTFATLIVTGAAFVAIVAWVFQSTKSRPPLHLFLWRGRILRLSRRIVLFYRTYLCQVCHAEKTRRNVGRDIL